MTTFFRYPILKAFLIEDTVALKLLLEFRGAAVPQLRRKSNGGCVK